MSVPSTITVSSDALSRAEAWITERDALLAVAPKIETVETQQDVTAAAALTKKIRRHIADLEVERKKFTVPLDRIKKDIMRQETEMVAGLIDEATRIKSLSDAYATRIAAAAQAEAKRIREEEERLRQEAAARQAATEDLFGEEAYEPVDIPQQDAPPPEKIKVAGARVVKRWSHQVVNANQVPEQFKTVDDAKLRSYAQYCEKMGMDPDVPGVIFSCRMSVE